MISLHPGRWLPLLGKELTERANRRRTYFARILYALLSFFVFMTLYRSLVVTTYVGAAALGRGRYLFEMVVGLQFAGIYVFLPALMSGVISSEKENGTLSLLLVTDLRPWEILLQKYLGGLVTMGCLMLTGVPLLAVSYTLGGVSSAHLSMGVYVLGLTALQVGAVALLASSLSNGAVGSFMLTYALGGILYIVPGLLVSLTHAVGVSMMNGREEVLAFCFVGPAFYGMSAYGSRSTWPVLGRSLGMWGSVVVALGLARFFLVRRAHASRRNLLLQIWRPVDRVLVNLNRKVAGGIVLVRDEHDQPDTDPVAWREIHRKALGKARYLFRALVLLEVPTFFVTFAIALASIRPDSDSAVSVVGVFLWLLTAMALLGQAVHLIASERVRNTLPVLLTTPLTGAEIIRQKMQGLWRLQLVFVFPLMTVVLFEAWVESSPIEALDGIYSKLAYIAIAGVQIILFPRVLAWMALAIGLKCKHRLRALVLALLGTIVWCFLPATVLGLLVVVADSWNLCAFQNLLRVWANGIGFVVQILSPFFNILAVETGNFQDVHPPSLWGFGGGILVQLGVLGLVRIVCLRFADAWLGRIPTPREGAGED